MLLNIDIVHYKHWRKHGNTANDVTRVRTRLEQLVKDGDKCTYQTWAARQRWPPPVWTPRPDPPPPTPETYRAVQLLSRFLQCAAFEAIMPYRWSMELESIKIPSVKGRKRWKTHLNNWGVQKFTSCVDKFIFYFFSQYFSVFYVRMFDEAVTKKWMLERSFYH